MRIIIYKKISASTLILGFIAGFLSSLFSGEEAAIGYGAWIHNFYQSEKTELLLKALFSGSFFVFTVFLLGLFIFGYLFVYPTSFYWAYTFGFLITSSLMCFGREAILPIILKLPTVFGTALLLYCEAAEAVKFSTEIFTNTEFKKLRISTSQYIGKGLRFSAFSLVIMIYETFFVPKILNLWVSF